MENSRAFLMKEFAKARSRFFSGDVSNILQEKLSNLRNSHSTKNIES